MFFSRRGWDFYFRHHVKTGFGAHLSSKNLFTRRSCRNVKLTTHLHLMSRSRMRGALPQVRYSPCIKVTGYGTDDRDLILDRCWELSLLTASRPALGPHTGGKATAVLRLRMGGPSPPLSHTFLFLMIIIRIPIYVWAHMYLLGINRVSILVDPLKHTNLHNYFSSFLWFRLQFCTYLFCK
jgi:hypothetical protein